jgi:hypothetical protein
MNSVCAICMLDVQTSCGLQGIAYLACMRDHALPGCSAVLRGLASAGGTNQSATDAAEHSRK